MSTPTDQLESKEMFKQLQRNMGLSSNNDGLARILMMLPGNVYWTNRFSYYLGCNHNQLKSIGLRADQIIGKHVSELLESDSAQQIAHNDRMVLSTRKPLVAEESVTAIDGKFIGHYLSKKIPLFDESGDVDGLLGISIDISEQIILQKNITKVKQQLEESQHKQFSYLKRMHKTITGEDISKKEDITEATHDLLSYLENIIALMPGYVYWQDRNNVFLGCNDNQAEAAGITSRKNIIGKTNFDMPWKEQADDLNTLNQKVINTGKQHVSEEVAVTITGQHKTFLSHKAPLYNNKNKIIGILGVSFDITKQKLFEKELQQAKQQLEASQSKQFSYLQQMHRTITGEDISDQENITDAAEGMLSYLENIIALMPGHVYWQDRNNVFLGCNDNQARSAGISSRKDIIGKNNFDMPWKEQASALNALNKKVIDTGQQHIAEEETVTASGDCKTFLSQKVPLYNNKDKIIGILGISFDITQKKLFEQELRQAKEKLEESQNKQFSYLRKMHQIITGEDISHQENITDVAQGILGYLENIIALMPGHVYWQDRNNVFLGCNNAQAKSAGLSSRKEIIGKSSFDMPWKEQAAALNELNQKVISTGQQHIAEEEAVMAVDGKMEKRIFLSQKVPLYNNNNKIIGILGISFDITQQKLLEAELRKAKEQAETANELKAEFIHNMEHDIRTPFAGIYTMIQHLAKNEADPDKQEILNDVAGCAKELLGYCNAILDFSKVESGELPIIEKKFSIKDIIDSIVTMELPPAKNKGLDIIIDYDHNIPSTLIGDQHRLKRVLINLVSNSIKFTDSGYIKLKIELVSAKPKVAILRFHVEDSGIGIPQEKISFIYEKFTRISPSNQGLYKGMGLGLRIVKQFIHDMEGEIDVTSEELQGTCFICTIQFKIPLIYS